MGILQVRKLKGQIERRLRAIDMCFCDCCVEEVLFKLTLNPTVYIVVDRGGMNHRLFESVKKPVSFNQWKKSKKVK